MRQSDVRFSEHNREAYDRNVALFANATYGRSDERNLIDKYFTNHHGSLMVGGIGGGRTIPPLLERGFKITGVDITPGMIEECRRKFGNRIDLHVMDIQHTTFPDASFDYIFLPFHTLGYVDDVWETTREMHRLLKPNGVLIASVINNWYVRNLGTLGFLRGRRRLQTMGKTSPDVLWAYHFSMTDSRALKKIFRKVEAYGRVSAQKLKDPNWKDRVLAGLPFLDKSLYFVCTK
jgi:SAM-dependent methyltransferase